MNLNIDHIIPISKIGKITIENLQLLVRWENWSKSDKMPITYLEEKLNYTYFENNNLKKSKKLIEVILDEDKNNIFV